jgi:hypothetical protein
MSYIKELLDLADESLCSFSMLFSWTIVLAGFNHLKELIDVYALFVFKQETDLLKLVEAFIRAVHDYVIHNLH